MSSDVAAGRTLICASRNDWLAGTLVDIAAQFEIATLEFMSNANSVLEAEAITSAITGIERLLDCARRAPQQLARALGQGYVASDITQALQGSSAEFDPIHGPKGEEEGDGPNYLFAYLKSLLTLLGYAREQGLCVMHVRHVHPK